METGYAFYLDGLLLPVAPGRLTTKQPGRNETVRLISGEEINILRRPGLTELEFDALLPQRPYPFAAYENGFLRAEVYLRHLEALRDGGSKRPFRFVVGRTRPKSGAPLFETSLQVSLESYTILEDAEEGLDVTVRIALKQYRDYGTRMSVVSRVGLTDSLTLTGRMGRERDGQPQANAGTAASGDSAWSLARKYLGDGGRWREVMAENPGLTDPNRIPAGAALRLPGR